MDKDFEEIQIYLNEIKKKLVSFRQRAPIQFSFSINPFSIILNINNNKEHEIPILYNRSVSEQVGRVREYLRKNVYPKLTKIENKFVEPTAEELNKFMKENTFSFDEAFTSLSNVEIEKNYIIDKVDISKNTVILLDDDGFIEKYRTTVPISVLLKTMREFDDTHKKWLIFEENSVREKK